MDQEIFDDDVLSDSESSTTTSRPSSSTSSDMLKTTASSSRQQSPTRQDYPRRSSRQNDDPIKVLVFNGKCSKVFKSTLEDCVEDCILEFPGERNSIYVSKSGQSMPVPLGSNRHSISSLRETSATTRQSTRSNRQRNPINMFSLANTALSMANAVRLRHQKFSLTEEITEDLNEHTPMIETEKVNERPSIYSEQVMSPFPKRNLSSFCSPSFPLMKTSSATSNRRRNYRLSDLVMNGPDYYASVFHLPRQSTIKKSENLSEIDRIKQDLFHRYLWTQKPQVSCRILPISTYTRCSTFVN